MTEQQFSRLERKIDQLIKETKKATWVNGQMVAELTGWDTNKLRAMREQGIVKFQKSGIKTIKYQLESIPEIFIKQRN